MGGAREEIKGFDIFDLVFFEQKFNVAGLGSGITRKVNNFSGYNFEKFID